MPITERSRTEQAIELERVRSYLLGSVEATKATHGYGRAKGIEREVQRRVCEGITALADLLRQGAHRSTVADPSRILAPLLDDHPERRDERARIVVWLIEIASATKVDILTQRNELMDRNVGWCVAVTLEAFASGIAAGWHHDPTAVLLLNTSLAGLKDGRAGAQS